MSRALQLVLKQVARLREEEAREDAWFILPPAEDEDVNWMAFSVEIEGPKEYDPSPSGEPRASPYAEGLFRVALKLSDSYPAEAPDVRFTTRLWHPLVNEADGRLCVDFLKSQWTPTLGVRDVLVALRRMLAQPHLNNELSVNTSAKEELSDLARFDAHARAEVAKYALG